MAYSFDEFSLKAQEAVERVTTDIARLRTGRASAQMLDPVQVTAYGAQLKLIEVASIQAPDPTLLVVTPWDKNLLEDVEKGITAAGLNLNPVVDGDVVRIAVPPLTQETRERMVKELHQKMEQGKVQLRNLRTDTKQDIVEQKNTAGVSEDDVERDLEELEKLLKEFIEKLEAIGAKKEKELLSV